MSCDAQLTSRDLLTFSSAEVKSHSKFSVLSFFSFFGYSFSYFVVDINLINLSSFLGFFPYLFASFAFNFDLLFHLFILSLFCLQKSPGGTWEKS